MCWTLPGMIRLVVLAEGLTSRPMLPLLLRAELDSGEGEMVLLLAAEDDTCPSKELLLSCCCKGDVWREDNEGRGDTECGETERPEEGGVGVGGEEVVGVYELDRGDERGRGSPASSPVRGASWLEAFVGDDATFREALREGMGTPPLPVTATSGLIDLGGCIGERGVAGVVSRTCGADTRVLLLPLSDRLETLPCTLALPRMFMAAALESGGRENPGMVATLARESCDRTRF